MDKRQKEEPYDQYIYENMPNLNIIITQEMEYILPIRLANLKKMIIRICKRTSHS